MAHEATKPQREITPEEWQRVREILANAVEIADSERSAYLDQACGSDSVLRGRIDELIAAHDATEASSLDVPAFSITSSDSRQQELRPSEIGRRIGAYRIEAEIAHGGMGTVYRAVRADDEYQKQVAIKLMDRGTLSRRGAELFRHERQILASLEHPNIARLLDGATSDDGSPYLVMEYVEGQTITQYCDIHRLSVEDRLKLFQKVCSAVHFAHQNLIVHRDIKPANILVKADGDPKLLDFGIAKFLGSNSTETQTRTFGAMTPAYASPEQLNGHPITTATDVYSLGLVLYELLVGRYAYDQFSSPARRQQAILEDDPERPSQAVLRESVEPEQSVSPQQVGALRQLPVEKLAKRLTGDLESIISKSIRKEPEHRYRSVDQLSDDIRRHLDHLPVLARSDTFAYRASKFIFRHKVGVAAVVAVALTVIAGLVVTLREARIAKTNELRAERRFNDVRKLANSLMFEINDSIRQVPGTMPARKLIIQRAQEYLDSLAQESSNDPALLRELAAAYGKLADVQGSTQDSNLGDTAGALPNYRKAVTLLERASALQPDNQELRRELGQRYVDLSRALGLRAGDKAEYRKMLDRALSILEPLVSADPGDPETQDALAQAYQAKAQYLRYDNDFPGSLNFEGKALAIFERLGKSTPENELYLSQISNAHRNLGAVLSIQKKWSEALEHYRISLPMDEAQVARHPDSATARWDLSISYSNTGFILVRQGDMDGGLKYYLEALKIRTALTEADPQDTKTLTGLANTYGYISSIYDRQQRFPQAIFFLKKGHLIAEELSRKDPTNKVARERAAWGQANIGVYYAKMAARAHGVPNDELKFCRESVKWIQSGLPILVQSKTEGRLWGAEREDFEALLRYFDTCRQTVARLSTNVSQR